MSTKLNILERFEKAVCSNNTQRIRDAYQEYNTKYSSNLVDELGFPSEMGPQWRSIARRHPALFPAVKFNLYEVTETLLELGANPNFKTTKYFHEDAPETQTPLWAATSKTKSVGITALLLKYGAETPKELPLSSEAQGIIKQAKVLIEKERAPYVSILNESIPEIHPGIPGVIVSYL